MSFTKSKHLRVKPVSVPSKGLNSVYANRPVTEVALNDDCWHRPLEDHPSFIKAFSPLNRGSSAVLKNNANKEYTLRSIETSPGALFGCTLMNDFRIYAVQHKVGDMVKCILVYSNRKAKEDNKEVGGVSILLQPSLTIHWFVLGPCVLDVAANLRVGDCCIHRSFFDNIHQITAIKKSTGKTKGYWYYGSTLPQSGLDLYEDGDEVDLLDPLDIQPYDWIIRPCPISGRSSLTGLLSSLKARLKNL